MDIKVAAMILALLAVIGLIFLGYVLRKQIPLLRVPADIKTKRTQYVLFSMALIGFLCTIVILGIDIATIFSLTKRSTNILNPVGVVYTLTIAVLSMDLSAGFWLIYLFISRDNASSDRLATKTEYDKMILRQKNDTLQADNDELRRKE